MKIDIEELSRFRQDNWHLNREEATKAFKRMKLRESLEALNGQTKFSKAMPVLKNAILEILEGDVL